MSTQSTQSNSMLFTQVVYKDIFISPLTFKKVQIIESGLPFFSGSRTHSDSDEKSSHYYSIADDKFMNSNIMAEITNEFSELLKRNLVARRAIFRSSQYGELNEIHQDFFENDREEQFFTGVLFLNEKWQLDWKGEFSIFNMEEGSAFSVFPKANRGLIFQSSLHHTISTPCRDCYVRRKTLIINFHEEGAY